MYPQPSSLPFDPTRITQPVMAINVTAPPFVPNYQCEDWAMPFRAYVAGCLMAEIQGGATRQPPAYLRIFAFNLFSQNNWNNEEFIGLFGKTMDWLILNVVYRSFPTIEEAVAGALPTWVSMVVAENTLIYRDLYGFIDQQQAAAVQSSVANMVSARDKITAFRARNQVWGYGNQQQQMQRPYGAPPQQPMMDPRMAYRQVAGQQFGHAAGAGGPVATIPAPGIDPRLTGSSTMQAPSTAGDQYSRMLAEDRAQQQPTATELLAPPFNPRTPKEQPIMQPQHEEHSFTELNDGSKLYSEEDGMQYWLPSEVQPHRPAYRPSTQMRLVRVMPDGAAFIEVHEKSDMEFAEHNLPNALTSVFGKPREGVQYDVARANVSFAKGAEEMADRMKWSIQAERLGDSDEGRQAKERADEPTVVVYTDDSWFNETSEVSTMVLTAAARVLRAAEAGVAPDVYRRFSYVSEPVICVEDQSELLRRFADSRTWLELAGKIADALTTTKDVALVEAVTRRAIVAINRTLALSLSIPPAELSLNPDGLDVETVQQLESILADQYPTAYASWKREQCNHIESIFQKIMPEEHATELRNVYVDPKNYPEGKAPYLALLTSCMSFTTLDVYVHDLDIAIDGDTGSLLTKENSGDLLSIVEGLFERLPKDHVFEKHIFQTNDGSLLEITKGDTGHEAYLLSRVQHLWFG